MLGARPALAERDGPAATPVVATTPPGPEVDEPASAVPDAPEASADVTPDVAADVAADRASPALDANGPFDAAPGLAPPAPATIAPPPLRPGALRVERVRPPRLSLTGRLETGADSNVRLLAPIEVVPGDPVADAFAGVGVGVGLAPLRSGLVAALDLDARRFLRAENGTLGGGGGRLGWRFALGPVRLEPSVDVSVFGWSAFPGDRHVAVAFAPEAELRRGRLSIRVAPSVLARAFTTGTDRELWLRADAWLELGALDLGVGYTGSDVAAASEVLSRRLHRGDLTARLSLPGGWEVSARGSLSAKALPLYPAIEAGGTPGREDRIVAGRLQVRWAFLPWLAAVASVDGVGSRSANPVADFERVTGLVALDGRWDPLGWLRRGPRPVKLSLSAPAAKAVEIAGDFTDWKPVALVAGPDGWSGQFELPAGTYRFGFLVDGRYVVPDGVPVRDDGFGSRDAVLDVID